MAASKASKAAKRAREVLPKTKLITTDPLDDETGWEELERGPAPVPVVQESEHHHEEETQLSKRHKRQQKKKEEAEIRAAELKRVQGDAAPTSIPEFEALVLSRGDSSFVWIQYMAFLISLGDVDKARELGHRALATINYREDAEKFHVWVALLNLETVYGTNDSAARVLGEAVRNTDDSKMYMAAVDVFQRSGSPELLERCLKALTKKFGQSPEVWLRMYRVRLAQDDAEAARLTMSRALQTLQKQDHVTMISQAGLLEFKHGDAERGRSIFEGVLRNYPKRLDLWNVYVDQEIKIGEQLRIRALFERATHLTLPAKKMKVLFKRWLEYEKEHGTDSDVQHVKQRALEFVQSIGQ